MLEGRTVLVTGGSRGLGRAMAIACAEAGADVIITGRDETAMGETVAAIEATGRRAWSYRLEVTDSAEVAEVIATAWEAADGIDACFNNAGVNFYKPAVEVTDEEFDRIIAINLRGAFLVSREIGRRMLEQGHGKLINVGSDFGIRGDVNWSVYSAAKGGLTTMSKALAWEWAPTVTVNVLAPGAFYTDMTKGMLDLPEIRQIVDDATPLGRIGDPDELGPAAVLLAGPGSDFMTGSILNIDGGIIRA